MRLNRHPEAQHYLQEIAGLQAEPDFRKQAKKLLDGYLK